MAPRPATDPNRWSKVSGGRNIRRQPQPSGMAKALGALPFGKKAAPTKKSGRGSKAGGVAMLTAAAGFAYKNRAQLTAMFNKRRGGTQPTKP